MTPSMKACAVAAAVLIAATPAHTQIKALRFARVVDGTGRVIQNGTVIVDGDRVVRVAAANEAVPAGAEVVDLRRYSAIPGLIDVHTHMTYVFDAAPGVTLSRQPPRTPARTG